MGLAKWLGFSTDGIPYEAKVEYLNGTTGYFPMFATDGRDALEQLIKLMPLHDSVVRIELTRKAGGDGSVH